MMKYMRFKSLIVCMLFSVAAMAQDPHFTQYYANALYLNPAMAGSNIGPRVIMNYRNQWPSIPGTFVTYAASYDQYFSKISGGIGIQALADRSGESIFSNKQFNLMYSNNINLTRTLALKTGFQAGYTQYSLNWNNLVFPDQLDARLGIVRNTAEVLPGNGTTSIGYVDFSAGMILYSEKFYLGFASHHLTQPNQSLIPGGNNDGILPRKYTAHAGANIVVKEASYNSPGTVLSPNIIFQYQKPFNTLNVGMYASHGVFSGGLWYRYSGINRNPQGTWDSFAVLAGVQQGVFRFGYSYDITVSSLRSVTAGSHEISVAFLFPENKKISKRPVQKLKCPQF